MRSNRLRLAKRLTAVGMCVLAFGVLLLIIKLTMIIAWYGGIVAIAGLILLAGGWILRRV